MVDVTKLEPTLTSLRERVVVLRQGRWSDGPEDAELMEHAADAIEQLEAENARLRELAGYMIRCMQEHHDCVDCLINGEQCDISCIESDLWELGIEVEL